MPPIKREWSYYPVTTLPAALDIVWCHFPFDINLGNPGPKPRPALVAETAISDEGNLPEVHVIYGTSKLKRDKRPLDFFVENYRDMHDAGLYQATRFDMDRHIWLPWASEWFTPPSAQYSNPAMGHLSDNSCKLLNIIIGMRHKAGLG